MNPNYRPDIDGLRGVAILSVILFHAFPEVFPGGFVGVDVFFVISGFVITNLILRESSARRFSLLDFYGRRARRLFPALFIVLAASLALGATVLLPEEFKALIQHTVAGAGFFSNFLLLQETGYFDTAAEMKPLLHLWSLSIEEQFYLLWPPLLLLLVRSKRAMDGFVAIFLGSLALNLVEAIYFPSFAFYFPACRFWELLLGCGLSYAQRQAVDFPHAVRAVGQRFAQHATLLSLLGTVLVGTSLVSFFPRSSYPGWWILLPATGALLIVAAGPSTIVGQILSRRTIVFVGLISYPLYLWHWPIFTFGRMAGAPAFGHLFSVSALTASFVLAALTFLYVEHPIRHGSSAALRTRLPVAAMAGLVLVSLTLSGLNIGGNTARAELSADVSSKVDSSRYMKCARHSSRTWCLQSKASPPQAALVGDSHAQHLFDGIATSDPGRSWLLVGRSSCPPVYGLDVVTRSPACKQQMTSILDGVRADPDIDLVVLAFFGGYFLTTDLAADHVRSRFGPSSFKISLPGTETRDAAFRVALETTVTSLEEAGKSLVIVTDIPELPFFPRDCVVTSYFSSSRHSCNVSRTFVLDRQRLLREMLGRLSAAHPTVRIYDPISVLCDRINCPVQRNNVVLYRDSHHLSVRGGAIVGRDFIDWLGAQ